MAISYFAMSNFLRVTWAFQLTRVVQVTLLLSVYSLPSLAPGVELKPLSQKGRFDDVNFQNIPNTETAKTPFMTPFEALDGVKMPDGFHASMFAAEPMVRQPIAFTTDARGRLWVADDLIHGTDTTWQLDVLEGMAAALQGWRKTEAPAGWKVALQELLSSDNHQIQQRARELLVVFGDGRALEELTQLAIAENGPVHQRRSAIRSLVMSRAEGLAPVLQQLLEDRDVAAEAIRGLAAFADPQTPELIIQYYDRLDADAQSGAINTLASRPVSTSALLIAVAKGKIERQDVPAYLIRQMWSFDNGPIRAQLQTLWPEFRHASEEKTQKIAEYQQHLTQQLAIPRDKVEEIVDSQLSMMPERLLDGLSSQQTRDLIAYLMSPQQVPLPGQRSEVHPTEP